MGMFCPVNLLKSVKDASRLSSTFRAAGGFFGQISMKVSQVSEMQASLANDAVVMPFDHLVGFSEVFRECISPERLTGVGTRFQSFFFSIWNVVSMIHVEHPFSSPTQNSVFIHNTRFGGLLGFLNGH